MGIRSCNDLGFDTESAKEALEGLRCGVACSDLECMGQPHCGVKKRVLRIRPQVLASAMVVTQTGKELVVRV